MSRAAQTDHLTHSQRVYNDALETATTDRVLLPDQLLTQDSVLSDAPPAFGAVFDSYYWAAHSNKARSWIQAAAVFNLILMPFDYLVNPSLLVATLVIRGVIVSAILLGLYILWGRQRPRWVQGATLLAVSVTIMLEAGALGALGGVPVFERYLTAGLFTVATAVLFFPIEFRWTIAAVVVAITLHGVMLAIGPVADPVLAMMVSGFYCTAIVSFAGTRNATLRSQWKSFKSKIRELRDQERLTQLNAELQLVADLDPLTGVQNRRSAQNRIDRIWNDATGAVPGLAVLMIDIDDFKILNDTFGHAVGDDCITGVANTISKAVQDGDIVSRYGGEEFLVVLPRTTASAALAIAERIRQSVETIRLTTDGSDTGRRMTVSIGLASLDGDLSPQKLIDRADKALYLAKHRGKNQTVISPPRDRESEGSGLAQTPEPRDVA
ncbi:GGDEF domain-containing protein [Hoeflea ulvae]|uniref:diguanylate cyclase n=1 Tax=Hoeflea ulvae TaxID=2983764 RepID=A0ABT3YJP1_9HYPH|nr:GGDEF domain-containing protein [Hoeflea ulvae]MCY0095999.1 GGDEF domain-containing protein [Hoeflea ulvae]